MLLRQVRALARLRRVQVSFDDAFRSAVTVFPELRRLGVAIQVFVCTRYARDGASLTIPELATDDPHELAELATLGWEELGEHAAEGVTIGSHTVSHPHLRRLSDAELRSELADSKAEIEAELGRPCTEVSYPYGEHDDRIRSAARVTGYERGYGLWGPTGDAYAAPRLDLYRRHTPARAALMATRLHRFVA